MIRSGIRTAVLVGALAGLPSAAAPEGEFDAGRAPFSVRVRGETIPYRVFGVFVMPGESVAIDVVGPPRGSRIEARASAGALAPRGPLRWTWKAPGAPGFYPLRVHDQREGGGVVTLNAFVMVPADRVRNGRINGYRIDDYPAKPLRGLDIYRPPRGFVELTPELADVAVAPHFVLGQFVCKQEGGPPKYLVLKERLLLQLEYLLHAVNRAGMRTDTFEVMSGYRTPYYNTAIGNVPYSRHVWGGAADIFVDVDPRDGTMDDLNRDGRVDRADAEHLYDFIESLSQRKDFRPFTGGLGCYDANDAHGPFVHVDVRGFRARWGR